MQNEDLDCMRKVKTTASAFGTRSLQSKFTNKSQGEILHFDKTRLNADSTLTLHSTIDSGFDAKKTTLPHSKEGSPSKGHDESYVMRTHDTKKPHRYSNEQRIGVNPIQFIRDT